MEIFMSKQVHLKHKGDRTPIKIVVISIVNITTVLFVNNLYTPEINTLRCSSGFFYIFYLG